MLFTALLKWWYGRGYRAAVTYATVTMESAAQALSMTLLLKTLFAPWKRMITYAAAGQALPLRLRGLLDNLISRFVGFLVRINVLLAGGLWLGFLLILSVLLLVAWPLFPLTVFWLFMQGF